MNIIEKLRKDSINNIFGLRKFSDCFPKWKSDINNFLGSNYDYNRMLNLGDNLSSIFKSTGSVGRGQSELSGGGYAWEGLIVWYLNFLFVGSRGVAMKSSIAPKIIKDAISVNYGSFKSNTESDIIVVVFPDHNDFKNKYSSLKIKNRKGNPVVIEKTGKNVSDLVDGLVNKHLEELVVGNIQCKTNWKDNAQIPMLWNMIYLSRGFPETNISVGSNGVSIQDFKNFTYSFVTVPTGKNKYKTHSTAVNRVRNLTGGNFWGKESQNQIAQSIKEIFNRNFSSAFDKTHRATLNNILNQEKQKLDIFQLR